MCRRGLAGRSEDAALLFLQRQQSNVFLCYSVICIQMSI